MYSKEEAKEIKRKFWITFAEKYPNKWILYNTKIKDFSLKFSVDNKKAEVSIDIECKEDNLRKIYYEKIESLKTILQEDYLPETQFERNYCLENGKKISRIWITKTNVSINNPQTWNDIFKFLAQNMILLESFFLEYEEYIKDLELNT